MFSQNLVGARPAPSLRRIKWLASGLLLLCIVILVLAKIFQQDYPVLGFVAAFAEAATIGGFADWYAVIALFRHPLGIPIPHTAIIAKNQVRIAESLARFIGNNFLGSEPVHKKLGEINFADLISSWLENKNRIQTITQFIMRLLPQILHKADTSGLKMVVTNRIRLAISNTDISPLAASLFESLTEKKQHQKILDNVLIALGNYLIQPNSIEALGNKIRQELPSLLTFFKADAFLIRKIIGSVIKLIEEVQGDNQHPLRKEVDILIENFITNLKTLPEYQDRLESIKTAFLNRTETAQLFQSAWDSLQSFVESDSISEDSILGRQISEFLKALASQLKQDEMLQTEMNANLVDAFESLIASQKEFIAAFISNQVKAWDAVHMTHIIENSVGRDLQYIRFNGTLIGGGIGVLLYSLQLIFGLK